MMETDLLLAVKTAIENLHVEELLARKSDAGRLRSFRVHEEVEHRLLLRVRELSG